MRSTLDYIRNVGMQEPEAHPLERWRNAAGIPTKTAAARLLGMLPSQYGDILAGRTEPSAARIREIVAATGGKVSADDLVHWKGLRGSAA